MQLSLARVESTMCAHTHTHKTEMNKPKIGLPSVLAVFQMVRVSLTLLCGNTINSRSR